MDTDETKISDELAVDLRRLANFIENNPSIAHHFSHTFSMMNVFPGDKDELVKIVRAAKRSRTKVTKDASGDDWFIARLDFGHVKVEVNVRRENVCERVVVGSEKVTEEVRDPEILATVPLIKQTRDVEKVVWRCPPILAGDPT